VLQKINLLLDYVALTFTIYQVFEWFGASAPQKSTNSKEMSGGDLGIGRETPQIGRANAPRRNTFAHKQHK
jgi:hypothetical protein